VSKGRAKIACSIDPELLGKVERLRASTGESRSAVIGRALAKLMDERTRAARIARYMQAYREQPESGADQRIARKQARRVLAALAWDDE
jgi:metal-responsive CopG/Arc/MetJ family transcriptional regulator